MKYRVREFKNQVLALKELEPFIRNGEHLRTGKPFKRFGGMRSREVLANWLVCAAASVANGVTLTFCSDPTGGDGIIYNAETDETWPTEHVMVATRRSDQCDDVDALILRAIEQKRKKGGSAYAGGKTLVVLLDVGAGLWFPNKVAHQLPVPLHFAAVWVVGLQTVEAGQYVYAVAFLDLSKGNVPTFLIKIRENFEEWTVNRTQ